MFSIKNEKCSNDGSSARPLIDTIPVTMIDAGEHISLIHLILEENADS